MSIITIIIISLSYLALYSFKDYRNTIKKEKDSGLSISFVLLDGNVNNAYINYGGKKVSLDLNQKLYGLNYNQGDTVNVSVDNYNLTKTIISPTNTKLAIAAGRMDYEDNIIKIQINNLSNKALYTTNQVGKLYKIYINTNPYTILCFVNQPIFFYTDSVNVRGIVPLNNYFSFLDYSVVEAGVMQLAFPYTLNYVNLKVDNKDKQIVYVLNEWEFTGTIKNGELVNVKIGLDNDMWYEYGNLETINITLFNYVKIGESGKPIKITQEIIKSGIIK